jgi:hypothetical protein
MMRSALLKTNTPSWNLYSASSLKQQSTDIHVAPLGHNILIARLESQSGQIKDYTIGISCFPVKHAAIRRKRKDWLTRNQDIVSEWGNMYIRGPVSLIGGGITDLPQVTVTNCITKVFKGI